MCDLVGNRGKIKNYESLQKFLLLFAFAKSRISINPVIARRCKRQSNLKKYKKNPPKFHNYFTILL